MTLTTRRHRGGDAGFSLVEMLAVVSIIALIAAISVPAFLSQRKKTTEAAQNADLANVNTEVQALLTQWKGKPPAQVDITTTADIWKAHKSGDSNTVFVATGKIAAPNSPITGTVWTNASYCLQSANADVGTYSYRSDTNATAKGACPTSPLSGAASIPTATAANVPVAPTIASTTGGTNSITMTWGAVSGANSYSVVLDAGSPTSVDAGSTTYSFGQVQPGDHTVYVRAVNTSGSSAASSKKVTVAGNNLLLGSYEVTGTVMKDKVWAADTFTNGWSAYNTGTFGTPGYRLYPDGTVRLTGQTNHAGSLSAGSSTIMTLPAGYRPTAKQTFTVFAKLSSGSASAPLQVDVATSGDVIATIPSTASIDWLSLTPIVFTTD